MALVGQDPRGVEHETVDVELALSTDDVADAHRAAAPVAGPLQGAFVGDRVAVKCERRWEPGAGEAGGMEQPVEECFGLVGAAEAEEGPDAE